MKIFQNIDKQNCFSISAQNIMVFRYWINQLHLNWFNLRIWYKRWCIHAFIRLEKTDLVKVKMLIKGKNLYKKMTQVKIDSLMNADAFLNSY